jgi:ethanolamine utilization protein EutP
MKKIMLIGKVGCGKTTLCQYLTNQEISYKKTQALEVTGMIIDTPGEYIERRRFYQALAVTSMGTDVVLLLQDPTDCTFTLPPGLQNMFQKPMIGVITKTDLVKDEAMVETARKSLKLAGADPIFNVCSMNGEGIPQLIEYITNL